MFEFHKYLKTGREKTTILIRFLVGVVFIAEGIQKFLYPVLRGSGRFESIGIPYPEFSAYMVGGFEIICGLLILIGLFTRYASIPLIVIMIFAIITTKIPILFGVEMMGFSLRELEYYGLLSMIHESRNDMAMLIGSIFLLLKGGGMYSLDLKLFGPAGKETYN